MLTFRSAETRTVVPEGAATSFVLYTLDGPISVTGGMLVKRREENLLGYETGIRLRTEASCHRKELSW